MSSSAVHTCAPSQLSGPAVSRDEKLIYFARTSDEPDIWTMTSEDLDSLYVEHALSLTALRAPGYLGTTATTYWLRSPSRKSAPPRARRQK